MIIKAGIYSVSFALARKRNRSRAADSDKIATFMGYPSLIPSCAGHFEPTGWRLKLFKFTFNVENFICKLHWSICSDFGTIRS